MEAAANDEGTKPRQNPVRLWKHNPPWLDGDGPEAHRDEETLLPGARWTIKREDGIPIQGISG